MDDSGSMTTGFRGEPLLSKASDLYTGTMYISRNLIFVQKNAKELQNRLDKYMEIKQGHDSEVLKAPTFYKEIPLFVQTEVSKCSECVKCLGISSHASAQLFSGDGASLAEVGQELERGTAEAGPDHDTGLFCCNIPICKTRTAISHAVPKGAVRLTTVSCRESHSALETTPALSFPLPGQLSSQRPQCGQRQLNLFHGRAEDLN